MSERTTFAGARATSWPVALVLENGRVFKGDGFGARVESIGEVVFNTSITGYQEIVSDPSYAGQIVVMTATQIGNVGTNLDDTEARHVVCAGLAIRELSPLTASWRSEAPLPVWLDKSGIPGIDGLDTRALTRVLRDEGAMRGAITPHVAEIAAVHPGVERGDFPHSVAMTPEAVVGLVSTFSYVRLRSDADDVYAAVRTLLATHPDTAGRDVVDVPYVCAAYRVLR